MASERSGEKGLRSWIHRRALRKLSSPCLGRLEQAGGTPELVAPESGAVQAFNHWTRQAAGRLGSREYFPMTCETNG
jgi:hypothetical protein